MIKHFFFFIALFFSINCYSQALQLDLSVPQPRLGESFYLSFSSDTLSKQIFNLAPEKFRVNSYSAFTGAETSFSANIEAIHIGQNEIGPLTFEFNGHTYKTNVIKFTVADSLPNVGRGIWLRKVPVNDSTVYIIIDQRIPAHNRITRPNINSISMTAEVNSDEKEARLQTDSIENAKIEEWGSSSDTKPDFTGTGLSYGSYYKCYKVTVLSIGKPLVLTKQAFENLPDYYKFENITIN